MLFLAEEKVEEFATFFNIDAAEIEKSKYGKNMYSLEYILGEHIVLRIDGPRNDDYQKTCHLELKGQGCRDFEVRNPEKTWVEFLLLLYNMNSNFTRIDIAIDDFEGNDMTLEWVEQKIKKKQYTSIFRSKYKPRGTLETGLTITLGETTSQTQLCIYDKLIQQAENGVENDKSYWVRYEMRFRHKKANAIAYLIMMQDKTDSDDQYKFDFKTLALEQLYGIIDFKVDNDKSHAAQKNQQTDPKYLRFLENVSKAKLVCEKPKETDFEDYLRRAIPYILTYFIMTYYTVDKDINLFNLDMYKLFKDNIKFSKSRFRKININLIKMGLPPITDETIEQLKKELNNLIESEELPF